MTQYHQWRTHSSFKTILNTCHPRFTLPLDTEVIARRLRPNRIPRDEKGSQIDARGNLNWSKLKHTADPPTPRYRETGGTIVKKSAGCSVPAAHTLPNETEENPSRYHTVCVQNEASPQSLEFHLVDHTPPRLCDASKACDISSAYPHITLAVAHPLRLLISTLMIRPKTGRVKNAKRCIHVCMCLWKRYQRDLPPTSPFSVVCVRSPGFGEARLENSWVRYLTTRVIRHTST